MAIKRFTAETWEEALRMVRAEFGDDAVILHSKTYKDGGLLGVGSRPVFEITATNDTQLAQQKLNTAKDLSKTPLTAQAKQDYGQLLEKAYAIASARAEEGGRMATGAGNNPAPAPREQTQRVPIMAMAGGPEERGLAQGAGGPAGSRGGGGDDSRSTSSGLSTGGQRPGGGSADKQRIDALMHDVSELKELVARLVTGNQGASVVEGSAAMQALFQRLLDNDVSIERAREVITNVNRRLTGNDLDSPAALREAAQASIAEMVPIAGPLKLGANKTSVISLIGPTGVGKTTTLSKLAANLLIKDRYRVGFITIDTYRLGAAEQLRTLANVLDVPMKVVMSPSEMRTTIREMDQLEVIFIDTAGRSHRDRLKMNELKTFLDAAAPDETHLCLAATTHPSHMLSALDHFGSLSVDKVILTKLDEAATYGPVLDVISSAGKPISYFTTGQDIPDDIELADARRLARLVLGADSMAT